jgi:hypothetical protein
MSDPCESGRHPKHARRGLPSHTFSSGSLNYEVCFHWMDSQWFATVSVAGTRYRRPLLPPDEAAIEVSDAAVRAGFISVGEWLVKTGRWPDPETKSLLEFEADSRLAA